MHRLFQEIGKALLPPVDVTSKALPAAAEANLVSDDGLAQKSESNLETTPEVNSAPQAEIQGESLPLHPRPLSPYPNVCSSINLYYANSFVSLPSTYVMQALFDSNKLYFKSIFFPVLQYPDYKPPSSPMPSQP